MSSESSKAKNELLADRENAELDKAASVLNLPNRARGLSARELGPRVELRCATGIEVRPVRWLWPGWLAKGKLHVLAGAPSSGKTTIALALAAIATRGGHWPCGATAPNQGNVLVWSGEDDPSDTLVPRLMAAGADLSRVFVVGDTHDRKASRAFDPAEDMELLEQEAAKIGNIALLIADPVVSAVAGDSHKNTEVRRALQPLVNLAARLDAAVLGISHFSKGSAGRDPVERVTGSLAFGAIARLVMVTVQRTDVDDGTRLLARAKSNLGPDGGGYVYAIEQVDNSGIETTVVRWGNSLTGSAKDLLGDAEADERPDKTAREEASDWLRAELKDGPRPPKQLKAEATRAGISWRTIERAKAELGVRSDKANFNSEWRWLLPKPAQDRQDRQDRQDIGHGDVGGLGGLGVGPDGDDNMEDVEV